ncbi:MAG: Crp/Fnr family transcriptional regulator [Alphaproteobacteria bacterium]|nr:Crp/Fnr family transcriptional regulator [Alphaproteobacteria bacterium]
MPKKQEIIESSTLLKGLPAHLQDELLQASTLRKLENGKLLFLHGDKAEYYYVIIRGAVKIFRQNVEGKESVLSICRAGESFAEQAIMGNARHFHSAQVVEKGTAVLEVPASCLRHISKESPQLALKMVVSLSNQMHGIERLLESTLVKSAAERVACYILQICTPTNANNKGYAKLPYYKSIIASSLNMNAETFSRALHSLKDLGVTVEGLHVHVENVENLQAVICKHCSCTREECPVAESRMARLNRHDTESA